jgi:hypothetical protein
VRGAPGVLQPHRRKQRLVERLAPRIGAWFLNVRWLDRRLYPGACRSGFQQPADKAYAQTLCRNTTNARNIHYHRP